MESLRGFFFGVVPYLAGIGGAWLLYLSLSPTLRLTITSRWLDETRVILHLDIENVSKARVQAPEAILQVTQENADKEIGHWIDFESPIQILKTTMAIYPNERIALERLHFCPSGKALHVGLQVKSKKSIAALLLEKVLRRGYHSGHPTEEEKARGHPVIGVVHRWTTVAVVASQKKLTP